ncbi:REP-associated tyrosine transposase [Candidatus Thiodictyon syntrophicum]|jgi:putative transposase|uniref:Transposase n=1 Tax=Candidatus Thiodictyon syntrophicum TaxID=1166950 RepID=A0A2K8U825_9GAMM|nr:transposase [Candidatus Thiodictyon syntrophicum]AUB81559.1 transposase [Candidatus Thiodictyon syntrophicum]
MSDYHRIRMPGGSYFFTLSLYDRRAAVLTDEQVRAALREAVLTVRRERPFHVDAWVLMPDHLHCIWTLPEGDADYSVRWSQIKRLVTQSAPIPGLRPRSESRMRRREGNLWQRRFWEHLIRDDQDFERHFDYVHWNPVKHGYTVAARDWPWSTFSRSVGAGLYPEHWGELAPEFGDGDFGEPPWFR